MWLLWLSPACCVVFILGLYVATPRDERAMFRRGIRDLVPLLLLWLGLRLMSREGRHEALYSIRHYHTMRGIPDVSDRAAWRSAGPGGGGE